MGGLWGEVPQSPLLTSDFSEVISWRQRRIYLVKSKDFHRWDEGPVPPAPSAAVPPYSYHITHSIQIGEKKQSETVTGTLSLPVLPLNQSLEWEMVPVPLSLSLFP